MTLLHNNLAIGLNWTALPNLKAAKSVVPKPCPWIARAITDTECIQALVPEESGGAKVYAGALILAATGSSVAIYQPIDDDNVWVCAASNGLPLIGFDAVLPKDEAIAQLQEIEDLLGKIAIYGDGAGVVGTVDDLIDITNNKSMKAAQLFKESRAPIIIAGGAIAILLTLGGAYFYITQKENERLEQQQLALAQAQAAQAAEQARIALEQFVSLSNANFLTYPDMGSHVKNWLNVFRSLPLSENGWSPSELDCEPSQCKILWQRDPSALISSYQKLRGESHTLQSNEIATSTITIEGDPITKEGLFSGELSNYLRDVSLLTTNDIFTLSYTEPAPFFSGVPEGQDLSLQKQLGGEGDFKITTNSPLNLALAIRKLPKVGFYPTNMKFSMITPLRTTYSIDLSGRYRVSQ